MLAPRESATRERICLDGVWRFALDAGRAGRAEGWWAGPLPGDTEMPVPASFNDVVPAKEVRDHVGDVWYQRSVRVPRGWDGERVVKLEPPQRYLAVVGAVCEGCCAVYDTQTCELIPVRFG